MAEVNNTVNEIPPNMTIYINNLNEKIKLEGILRGVASLMVWNVMWFFIVLLLGESRIEEVAERGFLTVREDSGSIGFQDLEAQRTGLGCVRRSLFRH